MQIIYTPASILHIVELYYSDGTLVDNTTLTEIEVTFRNKSTNITLTKVWRLSNGTITLEGANSILLIVNTEEVALLVNGVYEQTIVTEEADSRFTDDIRIRKGKSDAFEIKL
ncbi:MAG: hypothetical protein WC139_13805 [Candidatus Kapaibacterium sp.]